MLASSQWETALLCNDVSHWLGANLDSTPLLISFLTNHSLATHLNHTNVEGQRTRSRQQKLARRLGMVSASQKHHPLPSTTHIPTNIWRLAKISYFIILLHSQFIMQGLARTVKFNGITYKFSVFRDDWYRRCSVASRWDDSSALWREIFLARSGANNCAAVWGVCDEARGYKSKRSTTHRPDKLLRRKRRQVFSPETLSKTLPVISAWVSCEIRAILLLILTLSFFFKSAFRDTFSVSTSGKIPLFTLWLQQNIYKK